MAVEAAATSSSPGQWGHSVLKAWGSGVWVKEGGREQWRRGGVWSSGVASPRAPDSALGDGLEELGLQM